VNQSTQQVGVAFSRNAKRVVVFLAGFAIIAFAVGSELLLRTQAERSLTLRVETFRAALSLRDDDDLGESVSRLQSCTDGLIGAATLTDSGTLSKVYPDDKDHIELAKIALANAGTTIYLPLSGTGDSVGVFGALVDLPRSNSADRARALLLIRRLPYRMAWVKALLLVSAGVSSIAALRFYTMSRWFERHVVGPLRAFGRLNIDPHTAITQLPSLESGVWMETAQIAKQFQALLHSLNESSMSPTTGSAALSMKTAASYCTRKWASI
jgi:hypothetical protein